LRARARALDRVRRSLKSPVVVDLRSVERPAENIAPAGL
jgi:hypothetical protein